MRRLAAGLVAALTVLGVVVVPAAVSAPTAGAYPGSAVTFTGHGFGHGRGMGQYGAYGYARNFGWSYDRILAHYYGGTRLGPVGNPAMTVRLTARDGARLGAITSARSFDAGGVTVAAGSTATITRSGGRFLLATSPGCGRPAGAPRPVSDGVVRSAVFSSGGDRAPLLSYCGGPSYRGNLTLVAASDGLRTVNTLTTDDYLRGVVPRESPSSWGSNGGQAALQAQAVAARSYSLSENRYSYAKTCDTQSCQVYGGASGETSQANSAIATTSGRGLLNSAGRVVRAEFSSSTGGWSAGGTFPAVSDAGDTISPYHDWKTTVPVSTIERAYGVGTLQSIRVTRRNGLGADGGRVLSVQVIGSRSTVTTTGAAMRVALGLRSDWFTPAGGAPAKEPGLNFYVADRPGGPETARASFGVRSDVPLMCDWDGNGTDTPGVFRNGTWYLRNSVSSGGSDVRLRFGQRGDQPVCGDFDGNGTDTVGVARGGQIYLRNSNSTGGDEVRYRFGNAGDKVLFGDWDRNRTDTIAVRRAGVFYLSNDTRSPGADGRFAFGDARDQAVAGDWNGDGYDSVGVVRSGRWFLANSNLRPRADASFSYGAPTDRGVTGSWRGGPADGVGVAR